MVGTITLLIMFFLYLFQQAVTTVTGVEMVAQAIAGVVASFVLSIIKSKVNEGKSKWLTGPVAFMVTLVLSALISVAALWYQDGLHTVGDLIRSMGVVATSMISTYHLLIEAFGLIEDKKKK